jgi:hypothetical protein
LEKFPAGDSVFYYKPVSSKSSHYDCTLISGILSAFSFDFTLRVRLGGLNLSEFVMNETPLLSRESSRSNFLLFRSFLQLTQVSVVFSDKILRVRDSFKSQSIRKTWALSDSERRRLKAISEAILCTCFRLADEQVRTLFFATDFPSSEYGRLTNLNPKGFWRVDKDKPPELRQTVLTLVAFHDLQEKIAECGGDREKGIEAFCNQNDGEGWMIPESLLLADYGLGHDDRAREHQPVASKLGPRFFDWQLAQSAEESWRECELHARNLLGEAGYQQLLADIEAEKRGEPPQRERLVAEEKGTYQRKETKDSPQTSFEFGS